jgi:L-asparaginase
VKKKIKILGVGGTIASVSTDEGFKPELSIENLLSYIPKINEIYEIEYKQILNVDSSNLQPEDWEYVAQSLLPDLNDVTVHGIVITHGTDTMTYTASALALLIRNISKPIVFTGSQIPLSEFGSDAERNLIDAIRVAAETDIAESIIVFNSRVYRACRTMKLREYDLSAFETVNPVPIAEISRKIDIIDPFVRRRSTTNATLDGGLDPNIALIHAFPGLKPEVIQMLPQLGYKAAVIEGYGAGNLPTMNRSLVEVIKTLIDQNFPVIITSSCVYGRTELFLYEPGNKLLQAGAIGAFDMISVVALIKLMWARYKTSDIQEIQKIMHNNYCGEINPLIE